jgi:hypothetical protein
VPFLFGGTRKDIGHAQEDLEELFEEFVTRKLGMML